MQSRAQGKGRRFLINLIDSLGMADYSVQAWTGKDGNAFID